MDNRILHSYGIGTWLSNDVGVTPLNMVIKIVAAKPLGMEWIDCVKLSDTKGKNTGEKEMVDLCEKILNIK